MKTSRKNDDIQHGKRNSKGSKKKHVCGVVMTHKGASRASVRASFHNPNRTKNHHSKNRPRVGDAPHGKGTRAFDPQKWVARQRQRALEAIAAMESAA